MQGSEAPAAVHAPPAVGTLVVDQLREMITRGELAPGERLKEVELAASMGVSRGPVREAISLLGREGLVLTQRHRGARVISLEHEDIEEICSMRLALERLAMQRCAERIDASRLADFDAVLEQMRALPAHGSDDEHVRLDLAFHDLVYAAAGHDRLHRAWSTLRSQVAIFLTAREDRVAFRSAVHEEHQELRDVLASGDPQAAGAAIEKHIGWTLRQLRRARADASGGDSRGPLSGPGPEGKTAP